MKVSRKGVGAGLIVVAAGIVIVLALFLLNRPPQTLVRPAEAEPTERVLAVVGRIRPIERVEVRPVYPGQVVRLLRDEGEAVAAGEPLAVIRGAVEAAQARADEARVEAARAAAAEAAQSYERTRTLFERGFAARAALDQAQAQLRTAQAEVAAARATARASAERTEEFVVRAPTDSLILARPIDPGQVVATTTTLFELGATAGSEIEAEVDEAYGGVLRPGMAARISPTGSRLILDAQVTEVSPRIDASTGGRFVRLSHQAHPELVPGRSVDVTIIVEAARPRLLAPRQAVVDPTVTPKLYVAGADDRVEARPVKIDDWPSSAAIVLDGLAAGERVILNPAKVEPGQRIRPVTAP